MALTYRQTKGSALTIEELDTNFEYFTGSHAITGSLIVTEGITGSIASASYALTASYVLNGGSGSNIDTNSFATTSSNIFVGNQTISGSINFGDGSLIQSISSSSGDGLGASTLELTPDVNLLTDQYIVLDPTSPNHIHIRAGGAIDSSSAYLYLGGEKSNIVVRNLDNSFNEKHWVQINSQTGSTQSTWTFDDNGNTLFPTLTTPRGDINSGDLTTNTLKLGDGFNEAVISTPNGIDGSLSSQRLVINPGQGSGSGEGGDIYLWAGRGGVDSGTGGDIKVRGGYGPVSGSGGYVRIEGGDTTNGTAGFVEIKGGNSNTEQGGDVYIYGGFGNGNTQNGNITIATYDTNGSQKSWVFDADGTLTIPDLLQLPVRITNPGSPVEGMIMASGSAGSSKLYYYDGSTWVDLTA
jgi:hypothetical protein